MDASPWESLITMEQSLTASLFLLAAGQYAAGDLVYTKDGKELRGIVIEDYKDRILFSTVDGETTIMKDNIAIIVPRQAFF